MRKNMEIQIIPEEFTISRVANLDQVDWTDPFCFLAKTDEEISLVCGTSRVPDNTVAREDGWRALRIQGILDFSLIGILSKITSLLAQNQIGIFAVSTYNTDYIFTKAEQIAAAVEVLKSNGYVLVE